MDVKPKLNRKVRILKHKKVPIWATIGAALSFTSANFKLLFLISLAGVAVQAVSALIPSKGNLALGILSFILGLASIFTSLWSNVAIVYAISKLFNKKKTDFTDSFETSLSKILPYLLASVLLTFILLYSTVLFIIPGLYFSVIYSLVLIAVIVEDEKKISPFKMSAALVKGYFWTVVLYGLAALLLMIPVLLVCAVPVIIALSLTAGKSAEMLTNLGSNVLFIFVIYIVQALIMPYFQSIGYMIYAKLKEARKGAPELAKAKLKPGEHGCLMAIGLIVLTVVLVIVVPLMFRG